MTLIAIHDLRVSSDMTENKLGHIDAGDEVEPAAPRSSHRSGAAALQTSLFVAVAVYAWVTVWVLEHWCESRSHSRALDLKSGEEAA